MNTYPIITWLPSMCVINGNCQSAYRDWPAFTCWILPAPVRADCLAPLPQRNIKTVRRNVGVDKHKRGHTAYIRLTSSDVVQMQRFFLSHSSTLNPLFSCVSIMLLRRDSTSVWLTSGARHACAKPWDARLRRRVHRTLINSWNIHRLQLDQTQVLTAVYWWVSFTSACSVIIDTAAVMLKFYSQTEWDKTCKLIVQFWQRN